MGEPWMMFTKDQMYELINNTTSEWTSINNINGRKIISNIDTSKYVFFPAAGGWNKETHEGTGSSVVYYTSTVVDTSSTICMVVSSSQVSLGVGPKYTGRPTRAIAPPKPW